MATVVLWGFLGFAFFLPGLVGLCRPGQHIAGAMCHFHAVFDTEMPQSALPHQLARDQSVGARSCGICGAILLTISTDCTEPQSCVILAGGRVAMPQVSFLTCGFKNQL